MSNLVKDMGAAERAALAANHVTNALRIGRQSVGVILGTGWNDKLALEHRSSIPLSSIPGYAGLQTLEGHAREYVHGYSKGKQVITLNGRIHLNEDPSNPLLVNMVRLQTETLIHLGVDKLIVTCAAGALPGNRDLEVGDLVVINGFVTVFAPPMPLSAGEFCSPEGTLTQWMLARGSKAEYPGRIREGGYVMVQGPFFEGSRYDKNFLASTGASIVGMSTLPEACIAALYPQVQVLAVAFITNLWDGTHSHTANVSKAKEYAEALGNYLAQVIDKLV